MSRSGYSDDCTEWALICWRGAVNSAIKGKRGQAFLRELIAALDALPEKKLIAHELEENGEFCALGAVGRCRGLDVKNIDPDDPEQVAKSFGIANAMAREIAFMNDEGQYPKETPESRWSRMRAWAEGELVKQDKPHG
jgi:hypothetical protein